MYIMYILINIIWSIPIKDNFMWINWCLQYMQNLKYNVNILSDCTQDDCLWNSFLQYEIYLQISKIGLFYMKFKCRTLLLDSTCASRLDCNQHNTNVLILFFTIHCPVDNIDCVDNKCLCTIDKVRFRCL